MLVNQLDTSENKASAPKALRPHPVLNPVVTASLSSSLYTSGDRSLEKAVDWSRVRAGIWEQVVGAGARWSDSGACCVAFLGSGTAGPS